MIKLLADILGYELLILIGISSLIAIAIAVYFWTLIINFLRGGRK